VVVQSFRKDGVWDSLYVSLANVKRKYVVGLAADHGFVVCKSGAFLPARRARWVVMRWELRVHFKCYTCTSGKTLAGWVRLAKNGTSDVLICNLIEHREHGSLTAEPCSGPVLPTGAP
jgi:hypothetical protein